VTPEDLDTVRQAFDAFAAADIERLHAFLAPDIEWRTTPDVPFRGTYRGLDEFLRGMSEWADSFDGLTTTVEEMIDAGDRVVVRHRMRARGIDSGVEVDLRLWQVISVRAGRIATMHDYNSRDDALAAT
jgi:ketosteroid isomerase-like protein